MVSTTSQSLPVSDPTFQVPTRTLLGLASFLTLRIRRVKYEGPCSFFTTPGRRCSASLRMRRPDSCSFNTVSRSRYGAPPRGWRPDSYPFNTIPRFRYGTSLRGLRPNDFPCGFIFIEMAKIVVGLPSLTQPFLHHNRADKKKEQKATLMSPKRLKHVYQQKERKDKQRNSDFKLLRSTHPEALHKTIDASHLAWLSVHSISRTGHDLDSLLIIIAINRRDSLIFDE
jgi:hypothetical protein